MFQAVSICQTVATTGCTTSHVMHTSNSFATAQLRWGHSLWHRVPRTAGLYGEEQTEGRESAQ